MVKPLEDITVFTLEEITLATQRYCACGGGGPEDCCAACMVWHALMENLLPEPPQCTHGADPGLCLKCNERA